MTEPRTVLPGSLRPAVATTGPLAPDTAVEATLVLRRRAEPTPDDFTGAPLTREQLRDRFGVDG